MGAGTALARATSTGERSPGAISARPKAPWDVQLICDRAKGPFLLVRWKMAMSQPVALRAGRAEVKGSLILVRFEQQEVVDTDLIVRGSAGEVSVEGNK